MQRELNLDYLLNEPQGFIQDYYMQKATESANLDQAKVSVSSTTGLNWSNF